MDKLFNKELKTAGSSGSADAAPRMTVECGRSMVEMLGVLAVMGLLGITGVNGYTSAMNQHRANEAVNTAMRAAVMLSAQRLANPNATLSTSDFGDEITVEAETNEIKLTFKNLPEAVRTKIKNMGLKNATIGSDENGALTFTFYNDLSERNGSSESTEGEGTSGEQKYEGEAECEERYCFSCGFWGAGLIDAGEEIKCFDTEAHAIAYCNAMGFTDIFRDDGTIYCRRPLANAECTSFNKYVCLENNGLSKVYRCVDIDPEEMGDTHWIEQSTCSGKCQEVGMVSSSPDLCK